MGTHAHAHAAVRYAVEHPERVRALVLGPGGMSGGSWPVINAVDLARDNWEFFLRFYAINAVSDERRQQFIENLRQSIDERDWQIMARAWSSSEIEDVLPRLGTPTLILHPRDYLNVPVERSMEMASRIANARMSLIDGNTALGQATSGIAVIRAFLDELSSTESDTGVAAPNGRLSAREVQVLRLVAAGRSNQQIADELVISVNTVTHHVANILNKTGAANRAEATSYAHRHGLM
jgi:DNA-binding NarL/FixJ family response regulator